MPNRMLRDWTGSDKVNSLSVYAERFFTRLIMKVDDYGCFYADERLLKSHLFPLLIDSIRVADLLRWMTECQKAGLIVLYEYANNKYLQILDFKQRLDKARSKFPLPDTVVNEFRETVNEFPAEREEEKEPEPEVEPELEKKRGFSKKNFSNNQKNKSQDAGPPPQLVYPFVSDEFLRMWNQWKIYRAVQDKFTYKSPQSEQAALSELANMAKGFEDAAMGIIRQSMANGWKGLFELKITDNGTNKPGAAKHGRNSGAYSLADDIKEKLKHR
jgi:hypothetical protein